MQKLDPQQRQAIEAILTRRAILGRLNGYTLETSVEIADLFERLSSEHSVLTEEVARLRAERVEVDAANHDCLAKHRPGEPMFILLGRDPDAHNMVRLWARRRLAAGGDPEHCRMGAETAGRMRLYAADPANAPASAPAADAYPPIGLTGEGTQPSTLEEGGISTSQPQADGDPSPADTGAEPPRPKRGEIRVFNGRRQRFIEADDRGDVWEILGPEVGTVHPKAGDQGAAQSREGWVLVPPEITLEMQHAYFDVIDENLRRVETDCSFGRFSSQEQAYRAMIAAAPLPSPPEQGEG